MDHGPKKFNAHRPITPIPAIPKRRFRALDRNFRGSLFFGWFPISYFFLAGFLFPFFFEFVFF